MVIFAITISTASAEGRGIKFFKGTYAEAIKKAKKEKKQIFIDFYTEWCGPCLNMAENIFVLDNVAEVYNSNFVSLKIDAEKGEGVELAKKFQVRSFPTYTFVNPKTGEMTHRSNGNKSAKHFIADTKGALNPKLSCFNLDKRYKEGNVNEEFMISYIEQKVASRSTDLAEKLFGELMEMGAKLTDKKIWDLYVDAVSGHENPYILEVSNNYSKFVELYGKKAVDEKLTLSTNYASVDFLTKLCDFEGKEYNIEIKKYNNCLRSEKYDEAAKIIDAMLANNNFNKQDLLERLVFTARINPNYNADSSPYNWILKQVEYLRYIAYNKYNRDDARCHFEYAVGLEYLIKRSIAEGKQIPQNLIEAPKVGKTIYDTRPAKLKQKPSRKKKK